MVIADSSGYWEVYKCFQGDFHVGVGPGEGFKWQDLYHGINHGINYHEGREFP